MTKRERRYHAACKRRKVIRRAIKFAIAVTEMRLAMISRAFEQSELLSKGCAIVCDNSQREAIIWQDKHIYIR